MTDATLAPRAQALLDRVDAWSSRDAGRALAVKASVTVLGPLVVLVGIAMLVLPGPGLVVIVVGLAFLALEYHWARRALAVVARRVAQAKQAALPSGASPGRRALGALGIVALAVAGFLATTATTALIGLLALT